MLKWSIKPHATPRRALLSLWGAEEHGWQTPLVRRVFEHPYRLTKELGLDDIVELLEETLDEEEATDKALTEIAKSAINQQAQAAE
jgi:uncharacterized protein DUF892